MQVVKGGNTIETRKVRVGLSSETSTEILEGLDVGEVVVAVVRIVVGFLGERFAHGPGLIDVVKRIVGCDRGTVKRRQRRRPLAAPTRAIAIAADAWLRLI